MASDSTMHIPPSRTIRPQSAPDPSIIGTAFFNAIMFWNHAETTAKQIVQLVLGQSVISLAVASEMGNRSIIAAIQTASRVPELKEESTHLKHFCKGYEVLLGYRNFFVHGAYATEIDGGETVIRILSIDGKSQVRVFNPVITVSDLRDYIDNVHLLIGYGAAIQKALGAEGEGLEKMIASYQSSLEKPTWLPALEKVPLYLQAPVPPPPASQV